MKINNNEIKMIIFDLDGTLLDSLKIWKDVDINFFAKRNLEMPSDYGQKIAHMGLEKASQYTKERFNLPESPEEILKEWEDAVYFEYANNVVLKDYAKEFLEIWKKREVLKKERKETFIVPQTTSPKQTKLLSVFLSVYFMKNVLIFKR